MPQLDFVTFFLQFFTICTLMFFVLWAFVLGTLEVAYMIIKCRYLILIFFGRYKIVDKIFYLVIKLIQLSLDIYFRKEFFVYFSKMKSNISNFVNYLKLNLFFDELVKLSIVMQVASSYTNNFYISNRF